MKENHSTHAVSLPTTHLGFLAGPGAAVDPSDQLDAPATREVGGDGVSDKEQQKASPMGLAEAADFTSSSDAGCRYGSRHVGWLDYQRSSVISGWPGNAPFYLARR